MHTKLSIVGMLAMFALIPSFVFAQGTPLSSTPVIPDGGVTVATVNIQDITAVQDGNNFTVDFNVSNREGAQPMIIYAVGLYQKQQDGKITLADQKVYTNDILALGENQTIARKVAYTAPSYLSGTFILKVTAKNSDGFPFGTVSFDYPITLSNTAGSIIINPTDCYLTIDKEKDGTQYEISKGVDVLPAETLIAHCPITSTFKEDQTFTPVFTLQHRSAFGKIVKTEKQTPIVIAHGAHIAFTAPVLKADTPQAYDANLLFTDKTGAVVSPTIPFHFVLRGESATFQNITLDKTSYKTGDTAILTVFWSGSADQFPGARIQDSTTIANPSIALSIKDGNTSCSSEAIKTIVDDGKSTIEKISVPITANCAKPIVVTRLINQAGIILANQTYNITPTASDSENTANKNMFTFYVGAVVVILLVIIGILYMIIKKNKKKEAIVAVFLGFITVSGVFGFSKPANADTITIVSPYTDGSKYITTIFSVNIDKSSYAKSCDLAANVEVLCSLCNNAGTCDIATRRVDMLQYVKDIKIDVSATVNGQTKTLLKNGDTEDQCIGAEWDRGQCAFKTWNTETLVAYVGNTVIFKVEDVLGSYFAKFNLMVTSMAFRSRPAETQTVITNIPYTVNDNECVLVGECGDAVGNYPLKATGYSGPFCEPGTPIPSTPAFPPVEGSTTWRCGSKSCTATRNSQSVQGICGDAVGNYPVDATGYSGPLCEVGKANPANPEFPGAGKSVSWTCEGNITCNASRSAK